jgi:hypothetical protein
MGRANPALVVVVHPDFRHHPAVKALEDAGHDVSLVSIPADLILHPAAHQWSPEMFETPYLKAALAAARKRRKAAKAGTS